MKFLYSILFSTVLLSQYKLAYSADFPTCTGCTLYASGTDGNLWGWENRCNAIATGGDGIIYGFENGNSCQINTIRCGNNLNAGNSNGNNNVNTDENSGSSKIVMNFYVAFIAIVSALIIYGY
ncbi:hypothetical protein H8356DRAFT_1068226 [Neocallimastix lanati (nom. inval.)]|nr:hypothetical protein H8356DRAFT_1068226 [Neocallimastix sp. JGI-2020a]